MNRATKHLTVFALTALMAAGTLLAAQQVDESRSASRDGEVSIEFISGSVRVIGWDKAEVEVKGTIGDPTIELEFDSEDGETSIEFDYTDRSYRHGRGDIDLEIHVPRGSALDVEAISADITVENLTDRAELSSVSGDIEIGSGLREVECETVSGTITLDDGDDLRRGEFATVSGSIRVRARFHPSGRFSLEAVSGDIDLLLPPGVGADFDVETFSGSIDNEIGPPAQKTSKWLPAKELSFTVGGGGARISIESFSGSVRIHED
jgi:DUF4097 and DUF4098 domain-containing protein YvlB